MPITNLGIIGGGQLGSMLSTAAKKLNIKTIIYCDDESTAPAWHSARIWGEADVKAYWEII